MVIGILLDKHNLPRRTRAFLGWGILLVFVLAVHIWAYFYQITYTRQSTEVPPPAGVTPTERIDTRSKQFPAHIWLYIFCGLMDSMWQTTAYWMMGAMSNDPAKLAHFTGLYKSIQSAGGAVAWRIDGLKIRE